MSRNSMIAAALLAFAAIPTAASPPAAPLAASPSAAPTLARADAAMVAVIDAEQARTLGLLERLVNQNSGTNNLAGVANVHAMVRAELEPLGFAVRWVPMAEAKRAGHLIAHHPGRGRKLLLIGHLDTVFEADSPFQHWQRDGSAAHGPGAGDDKGGIVVMVAALRAMKVAGTLAARDITIVLTGDEEDAGTPLSVSRRDLIAEGKKADIALDFEGLSIVDGADYGVVARRGSVEWEVRVAGRPGHSSGVGAAAGYGAIYELARIIDRFRIELVDDKLTYNVGLVAGGTSAALDGELIRASAAGKTNVIAAQAVARGDLRALTPEQLARTQAKMRAIVADSLAGATSTIAFDESAYPPMAPTPGNRALLSELNHVNAALGLPAQPELDPLKRGAGDISFVGADLDGLIGLGPASTGDHTPAETVDIPSIWRQAKRAALLMSRLGEPAGRTVR